MIEQVIAQPAVPAGARLERLELGGAAPSRLGAHLQDAPDIIRKDRLEQLGDRRLVDALGINAAGPEPGYETAGLRRRLDHAAGEPSHLGIEPGLCLVDEIQGGLDQIEVDGDAALVDLRVQQEQLTLGLGQVAEAPVQGAL